MIADLLAATADAHSPRALVRAIATTLSTRVPIARVEIDGPMVAELADNEWRVVESSAVATARELVPGLSVVLNGKLPAFCSDPGFRAALRSEGVV